MFSRQHFTNGFIALALASMAGCTVAPFTGPNSAHTVGKSNLKAVTSVYPAVGEGLEYGLGDNTDIGALVEAQGAPLYSVWVKHALVQNEIGHSVAGVAGAFHSEFATTSSGGYAGLLWSYQSAGKWSPYGALKVNHVTWDTDNISDSDSSDLPGYMRSNLDNTSFRYYQVNTGLSYQFTPQFNASLGVVAIGDDEDEWFTQPQLSFGLSFP